ncbi:MAG: LacI family DNA-binding transcriptional regulator [candidate division KSB1 bacterium]|nr:LacI family DNA-binding transcriptional regulator [candidate division KSB1 bacterium]
MDNNHVNLETIANNCTVSPSTVSRVLNGKATQYRISKQTEKRILSEARKLNYIPNPMARGLRMQKTLIIGLIIPDISNHFFSSIAKSVEGFTRKNGYSIMLCDSQENEELEQDSLILMQNRKVDGLIVAPVGLNSQALESFQKGGTPVVVIDRYYFNSDLPYVGSDNFQGAYDAVNYMIKCGHRRIAVIQGIPGTVPNEERIRGYTQALKDNNIEVDRSLIVGDSFGDQNGYFETKILLRNELPPTAIFAMSNLISLGVLRALYEEGLSIPDDISMVAFDEQPYSEFLKTPMTTVEQKNFELGQMAMRLLFDQIETNRIFSSKSILLPTTMIKRNSVKETIKEVNGK